MPGFQPFFKTFLHHFALTKLATSSIRVKGISIPIDVVYVSVSTWLSSVSRGMLAFVRWTSSLHGSLFPHLTVSTAQIRASACKKVSSDLR